MAALVILQQSRQVHGSLPLGPCPRVTLNGVSTEIYPLEKISLITHTLDGHDGRNRNLNYCLIAAGNDLEAVHAYLRRFQNNAKTCRAYERELTRFLLWCVSYRGIPMSGVLTDECEDYKHFLGAPPPDWVGPKTLRTSHAWRPFEGPLSATSQKYTVQALRNFFGWLVDVRYLGGNPWITVCDPVVELKENALDIEKALPETLWQRLAQKGGILDKACAAYSENTSQQVIEANQTALVIGRQYRLARAAILLMGLTGARREEATTAKREKLTPVSEENGDLWELKVLGKRTKWRTLFLPRRLIDAFRSHWKDRGLEFDEAQAFPLLSPVVLPPTKAAKQKHLVKDGNGSRLAQKSFTPDALYRVVKKALLRMADDKNLNITDKERDILRAAAPHAFRHTFATQSAAKGMPLDVLQRLMGHVCQSTTSIYVQAERGRSIEAVKKSLVM